VCRRAQFFDSGSMLALDDVKGRVGQNRHRHGICLKSPRLFRFTNVFGCSQCPKTTGFKSILSTLGYGRGAVRRIRVLSEFCHELLAFLSIAINLATVPSMPRPGSIQSDIKG